MTLLIFVLGVFLIGMAWAAGRRYAARRDHEAIDDAAARDFYDRYVCDVETLTYGYLLQASSDKEWLAGIKERTVATDGRLQSELTARKTSATADCARILGAGLLADSAMTAITKTGPINVAVLIRDINASNVAVEDQCLRACQAADIAGHSARAAELSATAAMSATATYQTVQAERPRRRAPLPRQVIFALLTVALDGVACYFAAQALGGSQGTTLLWTGLFLAVLAGGEVALDFYRDRNLRGWRALAILSGVFITTLGTLRFWFLATAGSGSLVPALVEAGLFTAATAGFLFLGYRALQAAETPQAWRARRQARRAQQTAQAARAAADRDARERDRLILAYLGHVRRLVLNTCPPEWQQAMESAIRTHLLKA